MAGRDRRPAKGDDVNADSNGEMKFYETTQKQDELEELAREEGDFDEATKNAASGKKPKKSPPTSSNA
jgi:hypothetical protein